MSKKISPESINKIKLSIVTVTYQTEKTISKTIESVLNQTFYSYEYIIIDGGSTDRTYEIECSFDNVFFKKGIRYVHISEPDNGIFDAMNKSLQYCNSEWIYFLNAGDLLYNSTIIGDIFGKSEYKNVDIIYGGVARIKNNRQFYRPPQNLNKLEYKMPFGHQASFVRTRIMKKYEFNTTYKLASDYELMIRLYKDKNIFKKTDKIIAVFDLNGASQTQLKLIAAEYKKIQMENGFYQKNKLKHFIFTDIGIRLKGNRIVYGLYEKLMKILYSKHLNIE